MLDATFDHEELVVKTVLYHRGLDGLVRYERAASPASELPITQRLLVKGPGDVPEAPTHTATPVEHNAWLQRCREAGYTVKVEVLTTEQK
jgi:hypothetical protein